MHGMINYAMSLGLNKLMINGGYYTTVSGPVYGAYNSPGSGTFNTTREFCDNTSLGFPATVTTSCYWDPYSGEVCYASYSGLAGPWGRGTQFSMCGTAQCTNMRTVCFDDTGECNYTCNSSAASSTCPAGYTKKTDGSGISYCHQDTYEIYAADPNCAFLGGMAVTVPGTRSATQYKWACKIVTNGCTDLEAKAL